MESLLDAVDAVDAGRGLAAMGWKPAFRPRAAWCTSGIGETLSALAILGVIP